MIVVVHGGSEARDAAARLLGEQYGYARYSLMAPVRDALLAIDPLIASHTTLRSQVEPNGWDHVLSRPVYRTQVVRLLGTTARALRATFGQDILVELLAARLRDEFGGNVPEYARVLVDDARHTDEVVSLCRVLDASVLAVETGQEPSSRLVDHLVTGRVRYEPGDIDELANQLEEAMGIGTDPSNNGRTVG